MLPGKGPKEIKVCGACYTIVRNPAGVEKVYAPPAALQKRLDALEHPGGTPVIIYKGNCTFCKKLEILHIQFYFIFIKIYLTK